MQKIYLGVFFSLTLFSVHAMEKREITVETEYNQITFINGDQELLFSIPEECNEKQKLLSTLQPDYTNHAKAFMKLGYYVKKITQDTTYMERTISAWATYLQKRKIAIATPTDIFCYQIEKNNNKNELTCIGQMLYRKTIKSPSIEQYDISKAHIIKSLNFNKNGNKIYITYKEHIGSAKSETFYIQAQSITD